ncbi:TetR/AcrR family transcriptional regulator [Nocardioides pantholopis]|uniref:TetR/AcrR family transcriptional regulator n=1 Tax=Nocardioides pantholopis TaxID=2483798 RepID=UPI000F07F00D|nr:TetR/AcrR family transcriptional regulator [Nocardioides pantholopis]
MTARDQWLEKGFAVLAAEGFRAVTIERLCAEMGLSKGSFYHHFGGVPGFEAALLEHFEAVETQRYVDAAEADPAASARQRLDRLRAAVVADGDRAAALEVAVRAWAAQDEAARAALERIDGRRLSYLESLFVELTDGGREARDLARTVYLLLLGSFHVLPPVPVAEVGRLWDRALDTPGELPDVLPSGRA